jgi:hypothetical protein
VVAYSLRNMEQFAIAEATGNAMPNPNATAQATAKLTEPHGGEQQVKEITVPDVLMHLVGHGDGLPDGQDDDDQAPDEDYIVGGTGVVKALQYVLGEKANDLRRISTSGTPGVMTPRGSRPGSSAGLPPTDEQRLKAKKMSTNLLGSARKIRARLQPAIAREAQGTDEMAYRRLMFLDQTLQSMIERFEDEYPETRITPPRSPRPAPSMSSSLTSDPKTELSINTQGTDFTANNGSEEDDDDTALRANKGSSLARHGSEVSLASRAQMMEEGHLHRLGQHMRREILDSPSGAEAPATPWALKEAEDARIKALGQRIEKISGSELKGLLSRGGGAQGGRGGKEDYGEGWEKILKEAGANYEDLRRLQEQDPEGWEQFRQSQLTARMNAIGR